jgi:hypothetical protein
MIRRPFLAVLSCAALVAMGCSSVVEDEADQAASAQTDGSRESGWGVVLGGITHSSSVSPINAKERPSAIACDLAQLGSGWVRVDAGLGNGDLSGLQSFIPQAHARGLKVLVLVHPGNFSAGSVDVKSPAPPLQGWVDAYVSRLRTLMSSTLTGAARADAYEIGNEPNGGQSDINAGAFAVLHDRVYRSLRAGRPNAPLIVSGGILNVWVGQPWWQSFFYHLKLMRDEGAPRPWDAFAIHPYHSDTYRRDGAAAWTSVTRKNIGELQSNLTRIYGEPSRLWVTEIGWGSSRTLQNGKYSGDHSPTAASQADQAELFERADDTLRDLVDLSFWYVYRDDEPEPGTEHSTMGLRRNAGGGYAPKALYSRMAQRLGGGGSSEACYAPAASEALVFDRSDSRRTTSTGDWRPFSFKAECGSRQAVTGLSVSPSTGKAHAARCGADDAARFPHASCETLVFDQGDRRRDSSTGDWAPGYFKGECRENGYVAGVSQTTSLRVDAILCCAGDVRKRSCSTVEVRGKDDRESGAQGDWDLGHWKGECGPGRYVAGVSRGPTSGAPHRLLCCSP